MFITKKTDHTSTDNNEDKTSFENECFVIMPITDRLPYTAGHFQIVYEHMIRPACIDAGFKPIRADVVRNTNFIVKDILKRLLDSPMAICDLSGHNPNVLFELGIRQAFNKPVTLIKDSSTSKIFDIDGIRCIEYDETLRVDQINLVVPIIVETLKNTSQNKENSLIELLSIKPAEIQRERTLSEDTTLILETIEGLKNQLSKVTNVLHEDSSKNQNLRNSLMHSFAVKNDLPNLETEFYDSFQRGRDNHNMSQEDLIKNFKKRRAKNSTT